MRLPLSLLLVALALAPLGCGGGGDGLQVLQNPNYPQISWSANATAYRAQVGQQFHFRCPPGGTPGSVWGTDTYTDDSSICTAAVHAEAITLASGGNVTIEMRPGWPHYFGSTRHGVTSNNYDQWHGSFVFLFSTH